MNVPFGTTALTISRIPWAGESFYAF